MNWKYEKERIYSENDKGELMAEVTFKREKGEEVNIDHVYVNPVFKGARSCFKGNAYHGRVFKKRKA